MLTAQGPPGKSIRGAPGVPGVPGLPGPPGAGGEAGPRLSQVLSRQGFDCLMLIIIIGQAEVVIGQCGCNETMVEQVSNKSYGMTKCCPIVASFTIFSTF